MKTGNGEKMERTHDRAGGASAEARAARKKVTILVGSLHKGGATHTAARKLLEGLESFGDVEGEIVLLGDHDLGLCRGCKLCFDRGEENCPLEGDRDGARLQSRNIDKGVDKT